MHLKLQLKELETITKQKNTIVQNYNNISAYIHVYFFFFQLLILFIRITDRNVNHFLYK